MHPGPTPTHKRELINRIKQGVSFDYLIFCNPLDFNLGEIDNFCLSQWYPAVFADRSWNFHCAAQFMMWRKALLFDDNDTATALVEARTIDTVKALGRTINNFDEVVWDQEKYGIVVEGNWLKFTQNTRLQSFLLSTGQMILAEANPDDLIWGIGLNASEASGLSAEEWPGLNLLGFALMEVRRAIESSQ